MDRWRMLLTAIIVAVVALLFLDLGFPPTLEAPPHAQVLIDETAGVYFAPSCEVGRLLAAIPLAQARELGFKPDEACLSEDEFAQPGRSITGRLLEWIGILGEPESRWNSDGTWNW